MVKTNKGQGTQNNPTVINVNVTAAPAEQQKVAVESEQGDLKSTIKTIIDGIDIGDTSSDSILQQMHAQADRDILQEIRDAKEHAKQKKGGLRKFLRLDR